MAPSRLTTRIFAHCARAVLTHSSSASPPSNATTTIVRSSATGGEYDYSVARYGDRDRLFGADWRGHDAVAAHRAIELTDERPQARICGLAPHGSRCKIQSCGGKAQA